MINVNQTMILLKIAAVLVTTATTSMQIVQECTLWLMILHIPIQEYTVIMAQEEVDGLLFRRGKMEVLILETEIGSTMKMDLEILMENFG